jgi:hypothetical protein
MLTRLWQLLLSMGATGLPVPLKAGSCSRVAQENHPREHGHTGSPAICQQIDSLTAFQQLKGKRNYAESRTNCLSASYGQEKHWQASGTRNCAKQLRENW